MSDDIPNVEVEPARRSFWQRMSVVWLVPLAALVIALGVAWQNWVDRGPLIEIVFNDAAGVAANETELRYRDVAVGIVERVGFTDDLDRVVVSVRLDKSVADFVDAEAEFWVVRPEVTTQGVTGLDTVLSGVYLAGQWDTDPEGLQETFEGRSDAPLLTGGQQGLEIYLRTSQGSLSGSTPLLYKGVEVGRVGTARVTEDGFTVEAQAVIYAPYDNLVTDSTRFWDTSGFSFSIGSNGAAVDFDSLASLIAGGLTFDTYVSGAPLAEDGDVFDVYADETTARASVFNRPDGVPLRMSAIFDGNVTGLAAGANVELNGLRIGQVTGLNGIVDRDRFGDNNVHLQAVFDIQPARLGFEGQGSDNLALDFLIEKVSEGLRARLATGNLLTGGLKVQLVQVEDPPPAELEQGVDSFPRIPSTQSSITDVAATAEGTLARIDALPIEELLQSAIGFLDNATLLVGSDAIQQTPQDIRDLLADIRGITGSEDVQALPAKLGQTMDELQTAITRVSAILQQVEEQDTVARTLAAIDGISATTEQLQASLEGVPAVIEQVEALAAKANALPIEDLLAQITSVSTSVDALLASDTTQALPGQIGALATELDTAVAEARALIAQINEAGGADRLLAAVDAAGAAAASFDTSIQGVPALVERIDALVAKANDLPLQDLVTEATAVLDGADRLLASEETQALPAELTAVSASLRAALSEVQLLIEDVNASGGADRLLAAVDAAGAAAASLDTSLQGVPQLVERIDALAARATDLPLDELIAQATGVLSSADTILASEETKALPAEIAALSASLRATLSEAQLMIQDLNEGGASTKLVQAIDSANAAIASVDASIAGVPALVDRLNALATTANDLPLEDLVTEVTGVADAAQALIASDSTQALPGQLNGALDQLRQVILELREGGTVENANATLASARSAADEIAAAADALPDLLGRANGLLDQASGTLSGFDETSPAIRDARAALREVSRAAEAVGSLARALERRPNSLILGR